MDFGAWRAVNLVSLLDQHARSDPDHDAVVGRVRPLTYGALADVSARFGALLLGRGVEAGDRVGIVLPNTVEFLVAFLGALRIGAVAVPLNTRLRDDDLAPLLAEVGARVVLAPVDRVRALGDFHVLVAETLLDDLQQFDQRARDLPCVPMQSSDVSNIIFTSGSTSRPKGVLQTHGMHITNGAALSEQFQLGRQDATSLISPLFHIAGLTMLSAALYLGCPFTLHAAWRREEVLHAMEEHGVSFVHLIGTVLLDILNAERANPSDLQLEHLKYVMSGGAVIDEAKLRWFEERFGCSVGSAYGRSEGGKTWSEPSSPQRWSAHGIVNRNVSEVRIVDPDSGAERSTGTVGEIRLRGDGISRGYWGPPELTAAAFDAEGWMRTGDLGWIDDEEILHFAGRADGMIKSGGENVAPIEVERALVQIEGVAEAVVSAVPDDRLGQTVGALVVGSDALTLDRIVEGSRELLAGFKIPRVIRIVDEIPRLGSQKVDMTAVRQLLEGTR